MITPESLVDAGLFSDEQSVMKEATRVLWQERPQLRLEWAIAQYQSRDISLSKAAALSDVSYDKMKDVLIRRGIQPRWEHYLFLDALINTHNFSMLKIWTKRIEIIVRKTNYYRPYVYQSPWLNGFKVIKDENSLYLFVKNQVMLPPRLGPETVEEAINEFEAINKEMN